MACFPLPPLPGVGGHAALALADALATLPAGLDEITLPLPGQGCVLSVTPTSAVRLPFVFLSQAAPLPAPGPDWPALGLTLLFRDSTNFKETMDVDLAGPIRFGDVVALATALRLDPLGFDPAVFNLPSARAISAPDPDTAAPCDTDPLDFDETEDDDDMHELSGLRVLSHAGAFDPLDADAVVGAARAVLDAAASGA